MPAAAGPPRFSSKNARCSSVGSPRVIVQATIRPSLRDDERVLLLPHAHWKPVVRDTAWHGLAGQLGGVSVAVSPISMIAASAGAVQGEAARDEGGRRGMPERAGHARIQHDHPVRVAAGPRAAPPARRATQTLCTLTALGPLSPVSSS